MRKESLMREIHKKLISPSVRLKWKRSLTTRKESLDYGTKPIDSLKDNAFLSERRKTNMKEIIINMTNKRHKRFLIVAMIFCLLVVLTACVTAYGQEQNVTITKMLEANTNDKLFEKSNSILYLHKCSYGDVMLYRTKDFRCHTTGGDYFEAYLNGQYYCSDSEGCYAALGCFPMSIPLDDPLAFNQELTMYEAIVKEKKDGDHILLTTEVLPEKVQETMEHFQLEYVEGDSITYEYTLDAKTLLLLQCDMSITDRNGSLISSMHSTLTMDAQMPEQVEALYSRLTNDNHKELTIVLNPGTEEEEAYNSIFIEGEGVMVYLPEGYTTIYTDAECTQILGICDGIAYIGKAGTLYSLKD